MHKLLLLCALACVCMTALASTQASPPKAQSQKASPQAKSAPKSQAKPSQTKPNQASPSQAKPAQAKSTKPAATKPSTAKPTAKSTAKSASAKSKPQAKKTKKKPSKPLPKLPAPSVLESMAKKGKLMDFGEENLSHLATKLVGEAQPRAKDLGLRIAVFGDSHIAGDFIPRVLREKFMEVDSIGFAYPIFPAFHQNLLTHYQHKGFEIINSRKDGANSYPLGGIIARAKQEGATIKLALNFSKDAQEFSTRFVFKAPSTLGAFVIKDASGKSKRLGAKRADEWHISEPISLRFPIHIESLLPNAMLGGYIISKKNDSYVINLGINGARSDIYLKWEQGLWQEELGRLDLDLIILSYGSNDAISATISPKLYKDNFAKLIHTLRKTQPKASILLLGAPQVLLKQKNGTYTQSKSYEQVRQATKELAKEQGTLYFDMQELIDESGGKQKWITQALSKSDVHLTPYGYKLVAESLALNLTDLAQKHIKKPAKRQKDQPKLESSKAQELESTQEPAKAHAKNDKPALSPQKPEASSNQPPKPTPKPTSKEPPQSQAKEPKPLEDSRLQDALEPSPLPIPAESSAPEEIWQDLELRDF